MSDPHQLRAWPAPDWWRGFASAQLDDLIAQAERANYDLAAAAARVRQADAQVRIAGAALLPSVSAGTDVAREHQRRSNATQYTAALNASYEIDFWGKNAASREAARALAVASRYDRETVALSVVTSVATTYFQILALHDRLAVALQNLANAETVLKMLRAQLAAGIASALNVSQQETVVAALGAGIPALELQLRQSIHALSILVGKLPEAIEVTRGTLTELSRPAIAPGLPSELLARRPDVAAAEAQLVAANADIKAARAAFFPSVQLTAQAGVASAALSSLFHPAGALYVLAAGLTQPIFDGGRLAGQTEFSQARYDELTQGYRKAVISAFRDVEDALVATRETAEQEQRQQDAVAKARRAYEIAVAQLRAGTVDLSTVLNAQNALFPAEDALLQVKLAALQAHVSLFKALGGGWRQDP